MWKLKLAEGGNNVAWLRSVNNHVGRQVWEFDPNLGSSEDLAEIENARQYFSDHRFQQKDSSDLIMRFQFSKENGQNITLPQIKVGDTEDITVEAVTNTLKRAIRYHSTIQAHDGHWPGDCAGPMFLLPGMIISLYITGALTAVLSKEQSIYTRCVVISIIIRTKMVDGVYILKEQALCWVLLLAMSRYDYSDKASPIIDR